MTADQSSLPDLLVLTHRVPHPPDRGDRIRTYHLLRILCGWARVHLACLADEPVDSNTLHVLESICTRVAMFPVDPRACLWRAGWSLVRGEAASLGAFHDPRLAGLVAQWTAETHFHAALASASSLAPYLRPIAQRGVPTVIDLVDVDSQKWLDYAQASQWPKSWLYHLEGGRLRLWERGLAHWARCLTLVSESEADLYRRACGAGPVVAITNGVDLDTFHMVPQGPNDGHCVFVGALDYRPNVDGVRWFVREAWPETRRLHPGATLALVGRRPVAAIRRLAGRDGTTLVGQVADVRPYLARAAVAVVPLWVARGVQNKVLEAMAMGRAVVVSPQALEGLAAIPGEHLEVAESPKDWARTIAELLDDEARRWRLGTAARHFVEQHHCWETCLRPFAVVLGIGPCLPSLAPGTETCR